MKSHRQKKAHTGSYGRRKTSKKGIILMILAVLVILAAGAFFLYKDKAARDVYKVKSSAGSGKSTLVEYDGKEYIFDSNITNILLIGIDSIGEITVSKDYGDQPRADNIMLLSYNKREKTVKILPVSRDTMTEVTKFSTTGYDMGKTFTHLGFAYSFGNGGKASSLNVCEAVSDLLCGMDIYKYVTTNMDSIPFVNSLVGGVTVTVPNDDLAFRYPEMVEGAEVQITDENVTDFVRYRDTRVTASNNGRMERQRVYIEAYMKKLMSLDQDDYEEIWEKLDQQNGKIRTNIGQSMFLDIAQDCKDIDYDSERDNLKLTGTDTVEDGYDAFYPDEEKVKELVVKNFCKEF